MDYVKPMAIECKPVQAKFAHSKLVVRRIPIWGIPERAALAVGLFAVLFSFTLLSVSSGAAQTLEQLIAAVKKDPQLSFVAGPTTFGGKKAWTELESAFNKRFGLNVQIRFTTGPEMPALASRIITELKSGSYPSTDIYLGSLGQFALLQKEDALEEIGWSDIFPWISRPMEDFLSRRGVLVYTSPRGIIYNSTLIPKDKAPKRYEDLIDPTMNQSWAGKMAIPPYANWLVELSLMWGEEKVKDFTRKLVAISGGRLRYGDEERIVSGEFPLMANKPDALATMWKWQSKNAPLVGVHGANPADTSYFHLGIPKKALHPHTAKLFAGFLISKEAQGIIDKYDFRTSHLVEGTRMATYLREQKQAVQDPKELFAFYLKGGGIELNRELDKLLKR
jgi:ABC-type Fe3+ transport system substrate-binding protein